MPDLNVLLPINTEFWPVLGYLLEGVELATVNQQQDCQTDDGLGGRPDICDGVLFPGLGFGCVCVAAPDIDHVLAVDVDDEGYSKLFVCVKVRLQQALHSCETRIASSLDCGHCCVEVSLEEYVRLLIVQQDTISSTLLYSGRNLDA